MTVAGQPQLLTDLALVVQVKLGIFICKTSTRFITGQQLYSSSARTPQSCQHLNEHLSSSGHVREALTQLTAERTKGKAQTADNGRREAAPVGENGLGFHWGPHLFQFAQQWLNRHTWVMKVTASNPARQLHINGKRKMDFWTRYCGRAAVKYQDIDQTFGTSRPCCFCTTQGALCVRRRKNGANPRGNQRGQCKPCLNPQSGPPHAHTHTHRKAGAHTHTHTQLFSSGPLVVEQPVDPLQP